jgi:hypothetical protein
MDEVFRISKLEADPPVPPKHYRLVDWWGLALQQSKRVRMEFTSERYVIIMEGDPRMYGPESLEVRTRDGASIHRFEREQVDLVRRLEEGGR